jgi:hypothetical protein
VQTGEKAEDFTLIEIDKIHEVSDRLLADEANPPEDLEEFIDPLQPLCVEPLCVWTSALCLSSQNRCGKFLWK